MFCFDLTSLLQVDIDTDRAMGGLGAQLAISVNNCPPPRDPRSRMTSFKRTQRKYVQTRISDLVVVPYR